MRLTRSIKILLVLGLLLSPACSSLPAPPQGSTCVVDVVNSGADCVPIAAAVKRGGVSTRDATSFVPFSKMDDYICFSPTTWGNIENYIGQLKLLAKKQCTQ